MADRRLSFLVRLHNKWQPGSGRASPFKGRELFARTPHLQGRTAMQIEKHDKSYIVKLEDGSSWRIWPGDIALTLGWWLSMFQK